MVLDQTANAALALSSFLQGDNATYLGRKLYARFEKEPCPPRSIRMAGVFSRAWKGTRPGDIWKE